MAEATVNRPRTINKLALGGSGLGCGVYQLTGISGYAEGSAEVLLEHFLERFMGTFQQYKGGGIIVLWSDNINRPAGQELADLIEKLQLGTVVESLATQNFNYYPDEKHLCKVWNASFDIQTLLKYAGEHKIEPRNRNDYY